MRTWHDRFRADGIWSDIAALFTRAVRAKQGRNPEPATAILDSQSVVSGPQKGPRGVDGNKKVRGIKRHVLTCLLGFVLAVLVTAANVHDTQPVGALLALAARDGWAIERVKVDGIYIGPRMAQASQRHGVDVQVTIRERDEAGVRPLPLGWRVEATFWTLSNRWHRLTVSGAAAPHSPGLADCAALRRWTVCGCLRLRLMVVGALVRMVVGVHRAAGCRPSPAATGIGYGRNSVPGVLI